MRMHTKEETPPTVAADALHQEAVERYGGLVRRAAALVAHIDSFQRPMCQVLPLEEGHELAPPIVTEPPQPHAVHAVLVDHRSDDRQRLLLGLVCPEEIPRLEVPQLEQI